MGALFFVNNDFFLKETPNKSRRASAGSFSVMPRQMSFDVAMLRLHDIFLA